MNKHTFKNYIVMIRAWRVAVLRKCVAVCLEKMKVS